MSVFDLLKGDGFSMMEMISSIQNTPHVPTYLGDKGIFTPKASRTELIAIEENNGTLSIIQTSERYSPSKDRAGDKRRIVYVPTVRIATHSTIRASELANIRAFGSETEFKQLAQEVIARQAALSRDINATKEHHRLGCIQGNVLDADGTSVIRNWYTEFGIAVPTPVAFAFPAGTGTDTGTGAVHQKCMAVTRTMQDNAKGMWLPGTQVEALCGNSFFDKLTSTNETRAVYRAQLHANASLGLTDRGPNGAYYSFFYGGINFVNYRGTDPGAANPVGIASTKARFYPVGASPDLFQEAMGPGESFALQNQPGQPMISMLEIDPSGKDEYAVVHARAYPLFICTRPGMLIEGTE